MSINWVLIAVIAGAVLALLGGTYYKGHADGSGSCEANQKSAVIDNLQKDKTNDAIQDQKTPVSADRSTKLDWLSKYTAGN